MASRPRKTLIIKKVTGPNPVPEAPRVAQAAEKGWRHPDNLFRLISICIGIFGLVLSIILSRDQLFTSKEERMAQQREAIRLELEERYNLEKEKERQEQMEKERLEKEKLAKEEQARKDEQARREEEAQKQKLAQETKTTSRKTTGKKKKDPVGKFFRKVFS